MGPFGAAWLFFSFASATIERTDSGAEKAGGLFAALFLPLLVALLVRLLYVKVFRRRQSLPFWSPWILLIAAAVALLFAGAKAGERSNEDSSATDSGMLAALRAEL